MAFSPCNEFQEFLWNLVFRGIETRNTGLSTDNYLCLTSDATLSSSSTVFDAIAGELLNSDGYSRVIYAPDAATTVGTTTDFPDKTHSFTNSGSGAIAYDQVVLIYGGSATANAVVASIAANAITITGHGLSNGDRVLFTSAVDSAPSGITLSSPGSTTVYFVVSATTNTFQIAATAGGSAISLGTSWTGSLICRYANGIGVGFDPETNTITIEAGQTSTVNVRDFSQSPG